MNDSSDDGLPGESEEILINFCLNEEIFYGSY